jgi:hypothetical protein
MRKMKRFLLVILAAALVISLTMILPAGAATTRSADVKVLDQELVLCETNSWGEIIDVQVVNWLGLSGNGTVDVKKQKSFSENSEWQGVEGFTTPTDEGDYITWKGLNVDGNSNMVAATKLSSDMKNEAKTRIPLKLEYTYWLDGQKVKVEDITGKSGHFKMELKMTNTSREKTKVKVKDPDTGKTIETTAETYLPIVIAPYDWYFDNTVFFNLETDPTGIVFPMPEFYQTGWSIPLFPPATTDTDTIWVEADVKNFHMPNLTLPVAFVFPQTNQTDLVSAFKSGFEDLYSGVKQLQDGIQQKVINEGLGDTSMPTTLIGGMALVDDGLQQMAGAAGIPQMKTPLDEQLIPGVASAAEGAGALAAGTDVVSAGLETIYAGIGASTTPNTLLYAMNAMEEGLNESAAGIGSSSTPGTLLYAANAIIGGLAAIRAGVGPAGLQQYINAVVQSFTVDNFPTAPPGATMYAYVNHNAAYGGAMNVQDVTVLNGLMSGLNTGALQPTLVGLGGIYNNIGDGTNPLTLAYAANAVYGGLSAIKAGIGSATTPDTLLYAVDQVAMNLAAMQAGLGNTSDPNTLIGGMALMKDGLIQLQKGLSSGDMSDPGIEEGLIQISDGMEQVIAGVGSASTPDTLLYGTGQLASGLDQMKSGLQNDVVNNGTSVMASGLQSTVNFLNLSAAQVEAIKVRAKEFDSFLGPAQSGNNVDANSMVRFAYQTKPTYDYQNGKSWITALILSIVIGLILIAGGILLGRRLMA